MASVSISCPSCSATDGVVRIIMPTGLCRTVGRIRRSRRIRQSAHNA
ncbi:hypothetical protein FHA73_00415 [Escherichia coli]|nr:hypothetical protein [Escherichia coli]